MTAPMTTVLYLGNTYEISRETGEVFVIKTRPQRARYGYSGTYRSRITSPRKIKIITKLAIHDWVDNGRQP